jgi:hypothetical protein
MTTQYTNGRLRPSRPSLDPDRRRSTEPTGFWPLPPDQPLLICSRCACPVPATEKAERIHRQHHETVDAGLPR